MAGHPKDAMPHPPGARVNCIVARWACPNWRFLATVEGQSRVFALTGHINYGRSLIVGKPVVADLHHNPQKVLPEARNIEGEGVSSENQWGTWAQRHPWGHRSRRSPRRSRSRQRDRKYSR